MIFKNSHTFLDTGGQKRCTIELLFCTNWVTSIYNADVRFHKCIHCLRNKGTGLSALILSSPETVRFYLY